MRLWHLCVCVRPSVRFGLQGFRGLGFVVPFRDLFGRVARVFCLYVVTCYVHEPSVVERSILSYC